MAIFVSTPDETQRAGTTRMQISIKTRGFPLTEGLQNHTARRIRFAVGSASNRLRNIEVRLADDNGPRGGVDKRCTIRARLSGTSDIIIEHQESDLYVAIDRAADRLGRTLFRQLKRAYSGRGDITHEN